MPATFGEWIADADTPVIAQGGQGQIHLVFRKGQPEGPLYALKRLMHVSDQTRRSRFAQEISTCLRLDHKNIVKVLEADLDSDKPYYVMEYFPKGHLDPAHLATLSLQEKLRLFLDICRGFAHAHSNGVVHRDVKPQNILLREDGTPVVGDFGLCYLLEEPAGLTHGSEVVGNRFCTAPELEVPGHDKPEATADVYCLGKLLYWMLSGQMCSREQHRTPRFNLQVRDTSMLMRFVYQEVLDYAIVEDPSRRLLNASMLVHSIEEVLHMSDLGANLVDSNTPGECIYCRKGKYRSIQSSGMRMQDRGPLRELSQAELPDAGIANSNYPRWIAFACDFCGNVQLFRPHFAAANPQRDAEGRPDPWGTSDSRPR